MPASATATRPSDGLRGLEGNNVLVTLDLANHPLWAEHLHSAEASKVPVGWILEHASL